MTVCHQCYHVHGLLVCKAVAVIAQGCIAQAKPTLHLAFLCTPERSGPVRYSCVLTCIHTLERTRFVLQMYLPCHDLKISYRPDLHACCSKPLQEGSTAASSGTTAQAKATATTQVLQLLRQLPQQAGVAPLSSPTNHPPHPCKCWTLTSQKPGRPLPGGGPWGRPPPQPPS